MTRISIEPITIQCRGRDLTPAEAREYAREIKHLVGDVMLCGTVGIDDKELHTKLAAVYKACDDALQYLIDRTENRGRRVKASGY